MILKGQGCLGKAMFSVNMIRGLRAFIVSRSFSNSIYTATRYGGSFGVSRFKDVSGNHLSFHVVRRSFLNQRYKLQSSHPSFQCLSTATHSEDGNLIYTGTLGSAVRGVKLFSYSTSGASLFIMPHILLKTGLGIQSLAMQAAFCGVIGFFTFLTPILLHFVTKGYVIRLYHNPDADTYTAVTYSIFLTEKKNVFQQKHVRIPAVSKMFTTFYAGHMGLLVNPDLFPIPQDYNHLMGYDKPFNFDAVDKHRPNES